MSSVNRIISGSAATWCRIVIGLATQLALVPILLSHWDRQTFGIWTTVQAVLALFQLIDIGFQQYLAAEFLRIGTDDRLRIRTLLYSTMPVCLIVGLVELFLAIGFLYSPYFTHTLGSELNSTEIRRDILVAVVIQMGAWITLVSVSGIAIRLLSAKQYFPRMAWWGVIAAIVQAVLPASAVAMGAGIKGASLFAALAIASWSIPQSIDIAFILRREKLPPISPNLKLGFQCLRHSLLTTLRGLLETTRQSGIRILLAPIVTVGSVAAFAAMRTVANTALQGINTVTWPVAPELMRFLRARDQRSAKAAITMLWFTLLVSIGPAAVIAQVAAPGFFHWWTKGKLEFDSLLFASLSGSLVVFANSQPQVAVIRGNNLLKPQLLTEAIATTTLLIGLMTCVPRYGIASAGIAIALTEMLMLIGYTFFARKWLLANSIGWPRQQWLLTLCSTIATVGILAIMSRTNYHLLVCATYLGFHAGFCAIYWKSLPKDIRQMAKRHLADRMPRTRKSSATIQVVSGS